MAIIVVMSREIHIRPGFEAVVGRSGGITLHEAVQLEYPNRYKGKAPLWVRESAIGVALSYDDRLVYKGLKAKFGHCHAYFDQEPNILGRIECLREPVPQLESVFKHTHVFSVTFVPQHTMPATSEYGMAYPASWRSVATGITRMSMNIADEIRPAEIASLMPNKFGLVREPAEILQRLADDAIRADFGEGNARLMEAAVSAFRDNRAGHKPMVLHADLRETNIRVNGDGAFTGAIDFGAVNYTTPEGLFSPNYLGASPAYIKTLCEVFTAETRRRVTYRDVGLYAAAETVDRAIFFAGRRNVDRDYTDIALQTIRKAMAA